MVYRTKGSYSLKRIVFILKHVSKCLLLCSKSVFPTAKGECCSGVVTSNEKRCNTSVSGRANVRHVGGKLRSDNICVPSRVNVTLVALLNFINSGSYDVITSFVFDISVSKCLRNFSNVFSIRIPILDPIIQKLSKSSFSLFVL